MRSGKSDEHFVTLFDSNFLPMGMCLHASLLKHAQPFHLWILCMDELVEQQLRQLALPHVSLIPLQEVESDALLSVKNGRTRAEYCWTLTPFTPQFVFDRDQAVKRVTYLDADLFFFDSPNILLKELEESGKDVLITEHAYAPEYDQTVTSGRFCVQFMTFRRTDGGVKVMMWWQARCLEWCFNKFEDGKFGDQKYLDDWPERFASEVHVLRQVEKTLAPWNVKYLTQNQQDDIKPVMYHFHSLRLVSPRRVLLYHVMYQIGKKGLLLYAEYIKAIKISRAILKKNSIPMAVIPSYRVRWYELRFLVNCWRGRIPAATL
jgi:hypothetical protein